MKAGVYGRKSAREAHEGHERTSSESLQVETGLAWAAHEGCTVAPEHIWTDNQSAYKATETARKDFAKALAALERREIDVLWAYSMDRVSRRGAKLIIELIEAGRRLYIADEDLDTTREDDRRALIDEAERAYRFSTKLSKNVARAKERQRAHGEWLNRPPYGYTVGPKYARYLHAHPDEWPVVQEIFERAAGVTTGAPQTSKEIARALSEAGRTTKWGKDFAANTVWRIINNPVYEGWLVHTEGSRAVVWRNPHTGKPVRCVAEGEPTISEEVAHTARTALAARVLPGHPQNRQAGRRRDSGYLLIGKLKCAGCKGPMVSKPPSYGCMNHADGRPCPNPCHVTVAAIDPYVTTEFLNRIGSLDMEDPDDQTLASIVVARWTGLRMPEETREARLAQGDLKAAETVLETHLRDADAYPGRARAIWEKERDRLVNAVMIAEERLQKLAPVPALDVSWLFDHELLMGAWDAASVQEKREYLGLAVDRVTCQRGRRGVAFRSERAVIHWAGNADERA